MRTSMPPVRPEPPRDDAARLRQASADGYRCDDLCSLALDALQVGVVVIDGRGRVRLANAAARRLLDDPSVMATLAQPIRRAALTIRSRETGVRPDAGGPTVRPLGVVPLGTGQVRICGAYLETAAEHGAAVLTLEHRRRASDGEHDPVAAVGASQPQSLGRFGLTPQETRVAALLAEGRSNLEVAAALGVKPSTARTHTESVLAKLGVRSRAAVAARLAAGPLRRSTDPPTRP